LITILGTGLMRLAQVFEKKYSAWRGLDR